jgi:hypothetical protein
MLTDESDRHRRSTVPPRAPLRSQPPVPARACRPRPQERFDGRFAADSSAAFMAQIFPLRSPTWCDMTDGFRPEPIGAARAQRSPMPAPRLDPESALLFVINASAGALDVDAKRAVIESTLAARGRRGELRICAPDELACVAAEAAGAALARGTAVIAVGGDGSLGTVAQAAHAAGCPMGVIPYGTFNYFARTHGIPTEPAAAAAARARCAPAAGAGGGHQRPGLPGQRQSGRLSRTAAGPRGLQSPLRPQPLGGVRRRLCDAAARAAPAAPAHRDRCHGPRRADA